MWKVEDLIEQHDGRTKQKLIELWKAGVRFYKESNNGQDPESPRGWRRIVPLGKPERDYLLLCEHYRGLEKVNKLHAKTDEQRIEGYMESQASKSCNKNRWQCFEGCIEKLKILKERYIKEDLPEIRRREEENRDSFSSKIRELEQALEPFRLCKNPGFDFSGFAALLMSGHCRPEDREKVESACNATAVFKQAPGPTSEAKTQEQKPAKHLKKATNTFKVLHSSKHLSERRAFEGIYNTEKMKEPPPTDAAIIRKAKKDYPKRIGPISDSTIRKWIKNSDT